MDRIRIRHPHIPCMRMADIRRWAGNLAAIGLLLLAAWSSRAAAQAGAAAAEMPYHTSDIVDPLDPLAAAPKNPDLTWRAAVALLADPVDTRLGRSFDIQIATLVRSFQFQGYVLQGHALPWRVDNAQHPSRLHEQQPGVLVFRNDLWRDPLSPSAGTAYFVVFLVGESPVFGIQRDPFCRAVVRARWMNEGRRSPADAEKTACTPGTDASTAALALPPKQGVVSVLGPMFSGSMTSLVEAAQRTGQGLQLLSPSATVDSNERIRRLAGASNVSYKRFAAWSQGEQLDLLFAYLWQKHGICPGQVAILAEESSFGQAATEFKHVPGRDKGACERQVPRRIQFPQNIAAIRAEHAQLDARNKGEAKLAFVPKRNLELDMQDAGTSLDLPPIYQPSLTSRSDELNLQQITDLLSTHIRPKAFLIVATDVRDRLYMLAAARSAVPAALPVVLEADHLLVHPDYRRANRGTLMVQNTPLNLCYARLRTRPGWHEGCRREVRDLGETRRLVFATDYAAGLFRAGQFLLNPQADSRPPRSSSMLSVVTLAGRQPVPFQLEDADAANTQDTPRSRRYSGGTLIASDVRKLVFSILLPFALILSLTMVLCSGWLWCSSRPGRTILPPMTHALRELGWWLRCKQWRRNAVAQRAYQRQASAPRPDRSPASHVNVLLFLAVALALVLSWEWFQVMWVARSEGGNFGEARQQFGQPALLRVLHGRDPLLVYVLLGLYAWYAVLVISRISAWNRRSRLHWCEGQDPDRHDPHARRRYHSTALILAVTLSLPMLTYWTLRQPQTIDSPVLTTTSSFLLTVACVYFLAQGCLQWYRLSFLARELNDRVIEEAPRSAFPRGWPTPRYLHMAPLSPMTVSIGDEDWFALAQGGNAWPRLPPEHQLNPLVTAFKEEELACWRARTVAEIKFGLVCVRSCLAVALAAPLAILLMIQLYPFAFEWEHRLVALCLLALAFLATTRIVYQSEKAPMIGQMFTRDGSRVAYLEVLKAVGAQLLLVVIVGIATLSPNLGGFLQKLVGMLRF